MDGTQDDVIKHIANDPALYALLIAAYLLLFHSRSEKGKTLLIGIVLMAAPQYIYTVAFSMTDRLVELGLFPVLEAVSYLRHIGLVVCGYAFLGQDNLIREKEAKRKPAVVMPGAGLPPQFQRNRELFESRMQRERSSSPDDVSGSGFGR